MQQQITERPRIELVPGMPDLVVFGRVRPFPWNTQRPRWWDELSDKGQGLQFAIRSADAPLDCENFETSSQR